MDLLHEARARAPLPVYEDYDVIYTTGPDLVSHVYDSRGHLYPDIKVVERPTDQRFFRHSATGTWRQRGPVG